MVFMLKQCCCGCSLKTGTLILGYLQAIGGVIGLMLGVYLIYDTENVPPGQQIAMDRDTGIVIGTAFVIIGAIALLVAISLIIGVHRGNPGLLIPYIVYDILFTTVSIIWAFYNAAAMHPHVKEEGIIALFWLIFIVILTISVLINIYFALVVYSMHRQIKGTDPVYKI